jgi:hypothetical protein
LPAPALSSRRADDHVITGRSSAPGSPRHRCAGSRDPLAAELRTSDLPLGRCRGAGVMPGRMAAVPIVGGGGRSRCKQHSCDQQGSNCCNARIHTVLRTRFSSGLVQHNSNGKVSEATKAARPIARITRDRSAPAA